MPHPPTHPGEVLRDEMEELAITPTQLARQLNVPVNRITSILAGKRAITPDTALRLSRWHGTGPRFWLNLQQGYDLDVAEQSHGADIAAEVQPYTQPATSTTSSAAE